MLPWRSIVRVRQARVVEGRWRSAMSQARTIEGELLALRPEFQSWLDDERSVWADDDGRFTIYGLFEVLSHLVADRLSRGPAPELAPVFDYVESKLDGLDSEVDNAATTGFLENLMNRVPDSIAPASLVPLLGARSRTFCRAWDEWCGVRTEGLWP
jgi:hypothetical protein